MEIEDCYFDKNGEEIKEFAVLKVFHFKGVNKQGRGRKNYFMYKWVRLKEMKGKLYWAASHLNSANNHYGFNLIAVADKDRKIMSAEIVQQH